MFEDTIFSQLKQEHDEVKELFKKAEDCPPEERVSALQEIEENLVPHSRGEEKTVYALARERAIASKLDDSVLVTNEAYEEHHVADGLLAELKATDIKSERWLPLLKVLKENIEHHIKEEEGQFFDEVKKLFSNDERTLLLEDYLEAKGEYAGHLPSQSQIDERTPSLKAQEDFYMVQ